MGSLCSKLAGGLSLWVKALGDGGMFWIVGGCCGGEGPDVAVVVVVVVLSLGWPTSGKEERETDRTLSVGAAAAAAPGGLVELRGWRGKVAVELPPETERFVKLEVVGLLLLLLARLDKEGEDRAL